MPGLRKQTDMKKKQQALAGLPIGAIVNYAGDLSTQEKKDKLKEAGWLLCDGSTYNKTKYARLFAAIGTAHGTSGNTFAVPDLKNRFIRGLSANRVSADPDATKRIAAAPGGATGNNAGSLQPAATALPKTPWMLNAAGAHTHTYDHLEAGKKQAYGGTNADLSKDNKTLPTQDAGNHTHTLSGFDPVTIPKSIVLYFIIKATEPPTPSGTIMPGSIIGFGDTLAETPEDWFRCDGQEYKCASQRDLFDMILTNYGGEGTVFNVPDLGGYFLRGTNHERKIDLDTADRHELKPGGNSGDRIGSMQPDATLSPVSCKVSEENNHFHKMINIPAGNAQVSHAVSGDECTLWSNNTKESSVAGTHSHTIAGGGDKETRPENISVDFFISNNYIAAAAPPVGAILSFGADITDHDVRSQLEKKGWLPCDGSSIHKTDYPELYAVIGATFGSGPDLSVPDPVSEFFSLPDLLGFFVMGAGNLALGAKLLESRTGAPAIPFIITTDGNHNHSFDNVPNLKMVSTTISGPTFASFNGGESNSSSNGLHTHTLSGADKESRPKNVYVDFIIRYK
jgi:microcystin-dependent protein